MKKLSFYPLVLLVAWVMVSCNNQPAKPAHTEEEMVAAAKAVDAKFIESMNKKDLDGVMSCYWHSADLVMYPPGELEQKGWDAAKASFTKFFASPMKAKHELTETNYKVSGDMVIGWGHVKITVETDSTHPPMVIEGRYTDVLAYKDSNLVYVLDHASVPMQEPGPPPAAPEKKK